MKKLRFIAIFAIALIVGLFTAFKLNCNYNNDFQLTITNIEALAQGESTSGGCYGSGSFLCDHALYYGRYY